MHLEGVLSLFYLQWMVWHEGGKQCRVISETRDVEHNSVLMWDEVGFCGGEDDDGDDESCVNVFCGNRFEHEEDKPKTSVENI